MSKAFVSPEPWSVKVKTEELGYDTVTTYVVCDADGVPLLGVYNEANAKLIAAAPDLLYLLKKIVSHSQFTSAFASVQIDEFETLIAKATGGGK